MTITEPRTSRIAELLVELLTDDDGRRALMRIVLDELAKSEVTVRRLGVVDYRGRERVELSAGSDNGAVTVYGFGLSHEVRGGCSTMVSMQVQEECDADHPGAHLMIYSGDEPVFIVEAEEGEYAAPGDPTIHMRRFERREGEYKPNGGLRFDPAGERTIEVKSDDD